MQLMCLVWHSFSQDTRGALLSQCAHSVVSVAQAIEYVRIHYVGHNGTTRPKGMWQYIRAKFRNVTKDSTKTRGTVKNAIEFHFSNISKFSPYILYCHIPSTKIEDHFMTNGFGARM